jgi:fucose permease
MTDTIAAQLAGGRLTRHEARSWTAAVFVIFAICGIALAGWMARLPAVRDALHASTLQMGLLMVGISTGSIIGLLSSSHLIAKYGARTVITVAGSVNLLGLAGAGVGVAAHSYPLILLSLFVFGLGTSNTDVAMNLSGAANEKVMGRTLMPLFHALFSLGTVAGAALGAVCAKVGVPVVWQTSVTAVVLAVALLVAVSRLQHESLGIGTDSEGQDHPGWRERLGVWRQPTTLLIGLIVLGMTFAEGSAGDWLALGMVDERHASAATGAVLYGVFVTAMTVGRVLGVVVLDRYGRVPVLRATAACAVAGLGLVIFVPAPWASLVGAALWGLGASLGFPVGMSAAADDPRNAAARVSAVATIGYLAFLVGPPLLGFIGEHAGILHSLTLVLVLIALAVFAAPAARERPRRTDG